MLNLNSKNESHRRHISLRSKSRIIINNNMKKSDDKRQSSKTGYWGKMYQYQIDDFHHKMQ